MSDNYQIGWERAPHRPKGEGLSVVVQGVNPTKGQLGNVVAVCNSKGYDVLLYQTPIEAVLSGNKDAAPTVCRAILDDVRDVMSGYDLECVEVHGASAGIGTALFIAKYLGIRRPVTGGAGGVEAAANFMYNPVFLQAALALRAQGVTLAALRYAWRDIDATPWNKPPEHVSFVMTAGYFDPVIPYVWAKKNLEPWFEDGVNGKLLACRRRLGHTAVINDYNTNFREIHDNAQQMVRGI